jgi:hypothetical protein
MHHVRNEFTAAGDTPGRRHVGSQVWDMSEFLCAVMKVEEFPGVHFPRAVA